MRSVRVPVRMFTFVRNHACDGNARSDSLLAISVTVARHESCGCGPTQNTSDRSPANVLSTEYPLVHAYSEY